MWCCVVGLQIERMGEGVSRFRGWLRVLLVLACCADFQGAASFHCFVGNWFSPLVVWRGLIVRSKIPGRFNMIARIGKIFSFCHIAVLELNITTRDYFRCIEITLGINVMFSKGCLEF